MIKRLKLYKKAIKENKHLKLNLMIRHILRWITMDINKYLEDVVEYNMVMRRRKVFNKIQDLIDTI